MRSLSRCSCGVLLVSAPNLYTPHRAIGDIGSRERMRGFLSITNVTTHVSRHIVNTTREVVAAKRCTARIQRNTINSSTLSLEVSLWDTGTSVH